MENSFSRHNDCTHDQYYFEKNYNNFNPARSWNQPVCPMYHFRLFGPECYSHFSKILFPHLCKVLVYHYRYLATKSTIFQNLDLESHTSHWYIRALDYILRGLIDFCSDAF